MNLQNLERKLKEYESVIFTLEDKNSKLKKNQEQDRQNDEISRKNEIDRRKDKIIALKNELKSLESKVHQLTTEGLDVRADNHRLNNLVRQLEIQVNDKTNLIAAYKEDM